MYDLIRIFADDGANYIDVNDDEYYPVERFTWHPEMVGDARAKLKGPGRHLNFREVEVMPIEMEGHIKANTTELYWQARKDLLNIVVPDVEQLAPWHGYVMFKYNGDSNTYYQRVHLVHYEIPTEALYPTVTPFRFEWDGLDGYWLTLGTNVAVKL